jgi:hypothetical protein
VTAALRNPAGRARGREGLRDGGGTRKAPRPCGTRRGTLKQCAAKCGTQYEGQYEGRYGTPVRKSPRAGLPLGGARPVA